MTGRSWNFEGERPGDILAELSEDEGFSFFDEKGCAPPSTLFLNPSQIGSCTKPTTNLTPTLNSATTAAVTLWSNLAEPEQWLVYYDYAIVAGDIEGARLWIAVGGESEETRILSPSTAKIESQVLSIVRTMHHNYPSLAKKLIQMCLTPQFSRYRLYRDVLTTCRSVPAVLLLQSVISASRVIAHDDAFYPSMAQTLVTAMESSDTVLVRLCLQLARPVPGRGALFSTLTTADMIWVYIHILMDTKNTAGLRIELIAITERSPRTATDHICCAMARLLLATVPLK